MQIHQWHIAWRLLASAIWTIAVGLVGAGLWMFGMLMFTFSMDGASPSDIPVWLAPFMLLGWPLIIGSAVLTPAAMILSGAQLRRTLVAFTALVGLSLLWIVFGWIVLLIHS